MAYISNGAKLRIVDNQLQYPKGIDGLYQDLAGTLEYNAFYNDMISLYYRDDKEYGIVGSKKKKNDFHNTSGYIGYMIDDGSIYITRFSPTSKEQAIKWVRDSIKNGDVWIPLGELA